MQYSNDIEKLVERSYLKNLDVPADAGMDKRILDDAVARMEKSKKTKTVFVKPSIWRTIMKNHRTQLAAAAVITITVLIGLHYLGGSIDGVSVAWADVLEQISTFRPYTCTTTVQNDGRPDQSRTVAHLSLTQRREIRSDGTILVIDLAVPKVLTLYPEKKYAIERIYDVEPRTDPDLLKLVGSMESGASGESGIQEIGEKNINGHLAKGFRSLNEFSDITVWADVQTKLPVLVKIIHVGRGRTILLSDFTFDVKPDEALFSTTAPEGYKVEKVGKGEVTELTKFARSTTERDLVEGLRAVAVFLDGKFPDEIGQRKLQIELMEYVKQNNLSKSEVIERVMPLSEKWTKAHWYVQLLRGELQVSDFHYAGDGVKLGEAGKPLIWWLPKGSKTYRVIYGDLSAKDVSPEDLPK